MNKHQNMRKMIEFSQPSWDVASKAGIVDLSVEYRQAPYLSHTGREFINMCSCSYLGLDTHPAILEGAKQGIDAAGALHLTTARCRLSIKLLAQLEDELSCHFGGYAVAYNSCAAATSACLPILASGVLTDGIKPVMVFDKQAHFSMAHLKPLCADETQVLTCEHNDIAFLEDVCKQHERVVYVADGTYSIEGFAPLEALKRLQERYKLFLYLDDSHGLSITGARGQGHVLQGLGKLNERTIVVASLAKAFGAAGGMLLSGNPELKTLLVRYGNAWSQYLNSAGIGGALASLALHRSEVLKERQQAWLHNLNMLDSRFKSQNEGLLSPIRVVMLKRPDQAVSLARTLLDKGFYTSAVFFPVVPKSMAGLRVMPRADVDDATMRSFCDALEREAGAELCREGERT
ncbi:aminotransferase class I/II-fold pyridoxal phosphate-dependent enzyme [Pseudomonas shirazica]|uniref:aminotransferase class I/II-fold pyridoxal phosphate-dependent enzyme n=1 Tax=Pseudomonas asiatica TaxID=2219225 RepID=UPI00209AF511|nr:aminotransferase class I/II-fold pyridoxal phosphate-dependent enzyme [Pseudomonas asiatica]MCO7535993.1 aminotransferase class I/II-fold pyridoxal phosphate-dependent enzyme [Pseudomonas asiatica]MCO7549579.1 aminotransferase class I/II-fold pyridoxal phosphate-dependent enzyme [Pseudomonas asiatica]MCO7559717.1 aminotransferase class I/II-fold pyridoxal phosphate-dependent enzyme [Pseudomonas asiatica]UQB77124.1 aminotransferase class I/II-fold pyridoxal phosphate-dependent enzyme [Pseudom